MAWGVPLWDLANSGKGWSLQGQEGLRSQSILIQELKEAVNILLLSLPPNTSIAGSRRVQCTLTGGSHDASAKGISLGPLRAYAMFTLHTP